MRKLFSAAAVALWAVSAAPALAGQTALYFVSEPGDYIGQGKEVLLTTDDVDFFPSRSSDGRHVRFWMHNFGRGVRPFIWWNADFASPVGTELIEGTYDNATRYPFQDPAVPGLSFYGDGRGCNRLAGYFDVLEAIYDPDTGAIVSFAVDFVQYCEVFGPPLYGSIRYDSDIPLPTLTPPEITLVNDLNAAGCVEATGPDGATVSLTGSIFASEPVDFDWASSTGDVGYGTDFSFQLGVGQISTVTLTATDPTSGDQASDSLDVCVSDTTPPQVTILSPLEGENFVGENIWLTVRITDLVDTNITTYRKIVSRMGDVALDTNSDTSSTKLYSKLRNDGEVVDIVVNAQDFSGNVGAGSVTVYQLHDYSGN